MSRPLAVILVVLVLAVVAYLALSPSTLRNQDTTEPAPHSLQTE